ncbi:DoxX family protein [Polaribacter gochangensis]|mgnify:CR=1 FL=1|uniref:DoxX family protein n=1 Tax=Polaribacter gochangensis TaxID=3252903 RepID=UPI003904DC01
MNSISFLNKSIFTTSEIGVSFSLLIVRIGISFSMIYLHGYPRLINFSTIHTEFADPLGIGTTLSLSLVVFAEFFCSTFLIVGLFTRWSCIPLIITMIVATWVVNGGKGFIFQEKSFIFLITYICLLISGGGYFSLDYLLLGRKMKTKKQTH